MYTGDEETGLDLKQWGATARLLHWKLMESDLPVTPVFYLFLKHLFFCYPGIGVYHEV